MCDQRGPFGGDLTCTRPDHPEEPRGHVFEATGGPDLSGEVGSDE